MRIPTPGSGVVLEVDDQNVWHIIETGEELPDEFVPLLSSLGRGGSPDGGMPTHTRFKNGVIDVLGGELISITPLPQSVPDRVY